MFLVINLILIIIRIVFRFLFYFPFFFLELDFFQKKKYDFNSYYNCKYHCNSNSNYYYISDN